MCNASFDFHLVAIAAAVIRVGDAPINLAVILRRWRWRVPSAVARRCPPFDRQPFAIVRLNRLIVGLEPVVAGPARHHARPGAIP